jgi:heptosyltransferase-2
MRRRHFLIVRLAGIGDVLMASAAARRVRDTLPGARITWLTGIVPAPLAERLADVDDVIAIDEHRLLRGGPISRARVLMPLWARLLGAGITDVLLLHVDRRYRVLVAPLASSRVRTLVRGRTLIRGRSFADECARLVGSDRNAGPIPTHCALGRLRPVVPSARSGRPRVALVPGGTRNVLRESALKRWPVERYGQVARALERDADVVLLGDAHDVWVRPSFAGAAVDDRIGALTLAQTLDLMQACDLVIAHDTGPMHVARLAGVPLIALFGPTDPAEFAPEDDRTTVLWGGARIACRPCYDGHEFANCNDNICMKDIDVDVVVRTARTVLARGRSARSLRILDVVHS